MSEAKHLPRTWVRIRAKEWEVKQSLLQGRIERTETPVEEQRLLCRTRNQSWKGRRSCPEGKICSSGNTEVQININLFQQLKMEVITTIINEHWWGQRVKNYLICRHDALPGKAEASNVKALLSFSELLVNGKSKQVDKNTMFFACLRWH